uniref:Actin-related protein 2/3 complex subunit 5 n=1 Tax=Halisarca dujardinii TaxID=2583056 RepID=A0A9E9JMI2_HALDU|nr:ARPC5 [Halisarca dujardinii]
MSKKSRDDQFRRIDVDKYDEDKFDDDEGEEDNDHAQFSSREADVKKMVTSSDLSSALGCALKDPPVNTKDLQLKAKNFALVLDVLGRFKAADIEKAVKDLSSEELDILMKYLYRGFAEPTENSCGVLLNWHQQITAVGGLGSIIRVMAERKTV